MFLEKWALEIAGRGCAALRGCLQWAEEGRRRSSDGRAENPGTGMANYPKAGAVLVLSGCLSSSVFSSAPCSGSRCRNGAATQSMWGGK